MDDNGTIVLVVLIMSVTMLLALRVAVNARR